MTAFITGMGGQGGGNVSKETAALRQIDSRKQSFVNQDFVENISWLNSSVDTLSAHAQTLQSGVTQANSNFIEQIQGVLGDLFYLFAGLEPTGFDFGDLKYVIQGIGAFFGINPSTPFPLNLFQAAGHFFTNFIVPLDQFADIIFDAVMAWAEDIGLPQSFINSIHELMDAVGDLTDDIEGFFASIGDLLGAFGFGGFGSSSGIGELWDSLVDMISGISVSFLKPVLSLLANLGTPFIRALTWLVRGGSGFIDSLGFIAGGQIDKLGSSITPIVSASTLLWSVGSNNVNGWDVDEDTRSNTMSPGSFTTMGTGVAKRVLTQKRYDSVPGRQFTVSGKLKWYQIPPSSVEFGVCLVWFLDEQEVGQYNLNIAPGHGVTGGFVEVWEEDVTVPPEANGFKIGVRVGPSITTGQVWADDIKVQPQGKVNHSLIAGLIDFVRNILGRFNFPEINLSSISNKPRNLLTSPGFNTRDTMQLGDGWAWDGTTGRTGSGAARTTAAGFDRMLQSAPVRVSENQKLSISVWCKWLNLTYTGTSPIVMDLIRYDENESELSRTTLLSATPLNPATNQAAWLQFSGEYIIPDANTDLVKLQLRVRSNATGGSVWFDDADLRKLTDGLPQTWITNLIPDIMGVRNFITDVIDAIITAIRGIPFVGGTIANLLEWVTGWRDDTDAAASQAADAYLGLTTTQQIITQTATGLGYAGVPVTDQDLELAEALDAQSQQMIQQAAQIAQLQAQFEGVTQNGGISSGDLFEYVDAAGVATNLWDASYIEAPTGGTGYKITVTDGHNAGMEATSGNFVAEEFLLYIGPDNKTDTDYQKVGAVIASVMRKGEFGRRSALHIYMRCSADKQNFVRWEWQSGGEIMLKYRIGGGPITQLGTTSTGNGRPPAAAAVYGVAGVGTDKRVFQMYNGDRAVAAVTDTGAVTALGENFRMFGWGQRCDRGYFAGKITQFNANDNAPAPVPGAYLRVARYATTPVTITETQSFPTNVFDSVVARARIGWNAGVVTIMEAGLYAFKLRVREEDEIPSNTGNSVLAIDVTPVVGAPYRLLGDTYVRPLTGIVVANGVVAQAYRGAINTLCGYWDVPLLPGDTVRFSLPSNNGSNYPVVGTPDGDRTFLTVAKVG